MFWFYNRTRAERSILVNKPFENLDNSDTVSLLYSSTVVQYKMRSLRKRLTGMAGAAEVWSERETKSDWSLLWLNTVLNMEHSSVQNLC